MEVKVSLAETLKDWLSRKEMYSFSCSGFRRMAGVLLKDRFPSTDDIKGYAHIHSDSQQVIGGIKTFLFSIRAARKMREGHQGKARTRGKQRGAQGTRTPRCPSLLSTAGLEAPVHPAAHMEPIVTAPATDVLRELLTGRNASGTESLQPGPAVNLLIACR